MDSMTCGTLITFEGIDGSGKSSAAQALYEDLRKDYPVVLTREPGATQLGKMLRSILQNRSFDVDAKAEFLLFAADRAQHFTELVLPALKEGKIVISDRMADSSLAYQGYGRGVDPVMIRCVNQWAMQSRVPDATVFIEISYEQAQNRLGLRNEQATVFEQEQKEFFERVMQGFKEAFKDRSGILPIEGSVAPDKVHTAVIEAVRKFLHERKIHHATATSISLDRL